MQRMDVVGVRVEMPTNQPLVLLRVVDDGRYLPIWVGAIEASAIAFAHQRAETPRPLTHVLMASIIEAVGQKLESIRIVRVEEGVFFAELVFASGLVVDARPSDAIALALRAEAEVWCADAVLDEAAFQPAPDQDAEVERFREFLDQIEPEDFA